MAHNPLTEGSNPAKCLRPSGLHSWGVGQASAAKSSSVNATQAGNDAGPLAGVGVELVFLERADFVADEASDRHGDFSGVVVQRSLGDECGGFFLVVLGLVGMGVDANDNLTVNVRA